MPEIDLAERAWIHRLVVVARAGTGRTPSRWLAGGLANRHCLRQVRPPENCRQAGRRSPDNMPATTAFPAPHREGPTAHELKSGFDARSPSAIRHCSRSRSDLPLTGAGFLIALRILRDQSVTRRELFGLGRWPLSRFAAFWVSSFPDSPVSL